MNDGYMRWLVSGVSLYLDGTMMGTKDGYEGDTFLVRWVIFFSKHSICYYTTNNWLSNFLEIDRERGQRYDPRVDACSQ